MRSIKFLSVFCFLIIINLIAFSPASAQGNSNTTSTEKSSGETNTNKAIPTPTVLPVADVKPNEERYRIGLHDVLEVTVFNQEKLSQPNLRMDENGKIRLPRILEPITAICKTENELAEEIAAEYRKNYLRDPYVRVFVKEQNSQPLSVIGAVEKPGSFYTNRRLTLLELLSFAGGQDVEKAGTKIQVARVGGISGCKTMDSNVGTTDAEGVTFFSYNLQDVLKGNTNPVMKPGDIVVVLEADLIYVTGNVFKPQSIPLKQQITLTQAIAAAGGMLPASKKTVRVVRQDSNGKVKQELDYDLNAIKEKKIPDPLLQANDIVEVPTDKVKDFTNNFIKAITGGLGNVFYRIP